MASKSVFLFYSQSIIIPKKEKLQINFLPKWKNYTKSVNDCLKVPLWIHEKRKHNKVSQWSYLGQYVQWCTSTERDKNKMHTATQPISWAMIEFTMLYLSRRYLLCSPTVWLIIGLAAYLIQHTVQNVWLKFRQKHYWDVAIIDKRGSQFIFWFINCTNT